MLLLVLGGLRIDQTPYIPALLEFEKCGASTKTLIPTYPTFNYPNLYSIATVWDAQRRRSNLLFSLPEVRKRTLFRKNVLAEKVLSSATPFSRCHLKKTRNCSPFEGRLMQTIETLSRFWVHLIFVLFQGLYPESHGIVSFKMYDAKLGKNFTAGGPSALDPEWWHGEPIWNTLEKNVSFFFLVVEAFTSF